MASRIGIVHGFTQTSRCWGPLADALAAGHEVVAIDAPGHGSASEVSTDLVGAGEVAFEAAGGGTYLGYSMGGRIVLHTALAHPRSVDRLVLISATPGIADPLEREARRADDDRLANQALEIGVESFVAEWLARPMFAAIPRALRFEEERNTNTAAGLAMSLRRCGTGSQASLWSRLTDLACPTLLVAGADDPRFVSIAKEMAAVMPNATLEVIAGAGHTAHLEQPDAVIDAVVRWLG